MLYVVIPNLNGEKFIGECIESLLSQTLPPNKIVVVDNGSTDRSVDIIESYSSKIIRLINLKKNTGFTGGVNTGIDYALSNGAEFIALINNDADADSHWLQNLKEVFENSSNNIGFVTSKILGREKDLIDSTGELYSVWGFPYPRGRGEPRDSYGSKINIFAASGGATMYRASFFKDVGLFDQRYFAYYEDVDICFRGQLKGWGGIFVPEAIVHHEIGGTSNKMSGFIRYHSFKNFVYLYVKNQPARLFLKYLPLFLLSFISMNINMLIKFQWVPLVKGWLSILVNIPGLLIERWKVQAQKRVSSKHIDSLLSRDIPPSQKTLRKIASFVR